MANIVQLFQSRDRLCPLSQKLMGLTLPLQAIPGVPKLQNEKNPTNLLYVLYSSFHLN